MMQPRKQTHQSILQSKVKSMTYDLEEFLIVEENDALRHSKEVTEKHVLAWLNYKRNGSKIGDPDASERVREFLSTVQGVTMRPEPERLSGDPDTYCQGDWMNSVWSIYKAGFLLFTGQATLPQKTFNKAIKQDVGKFFSEYSEYHSRPELADFIKEAASLPNFIAVPDGFNTARALPTGDYWDLTLYYYVTQQRNRVTGANAFRRMVDCPSNRMFLKAWINQDGLPAPLYPDRFDKKFPRYFPGRPMEPEEWEATIREMTRRIQLRRLEIQKYLESLAPNQ